MTIDKQTKALRTERALKLALDALEPMEDSRDDTAIQRAITAIREALPEQPAPVAKPHKQQEPIAWWLHGTDHVEFEKHGYHDGHEWTPIYTSPPASKPWVGLTDEEIDELDRKNYGFPQPVAWRGPFARAVEAKLKERNA